MKTNQILMQADRLFYECRFSEVVTLVNGSCPPDGNWHESGYFKLLMRKVRALVELDRSSDATHILRFLSAKNPHQRIDGLYVEALLAFFAGDNTLADLLFREMRHCAENAKDYTAALFGLGYTWQAQGNTEALDEILCELEQLESVMPADSQLAYWLLQAHLFGINRQRPHCAEQLLQKLFEKADQQRMLYFKLKGLAIQARIYKETTQPDAAERVLKLLQLIARADECQAILRIAENNVLGKQTADAPVSEWHIDGQNCRITIGGRRYDLASSPLLFKLMTALNDQDEFMTKQQISELLWPEQHYQPQVHGPRVFDLMRRVRSMLEDSSSMALVSGRQGYKFNKGVGT